MNDSVLFNALKELMQVLTINDQNYAQKMEQLIIQLQDHKQVAIIRSLNEQFFLEHKTTPQAKQQIQQVLTLLGTSQKIQGTDEFFAEKQSKNAQGIGISILDNYGKFIITDKETRNILECIEHPHQNLVDFSCDAARPELIDTLNSSDNDDIYEKDFQMTIYSESIRRKAMKHLNSIGKKQLQQLLKQKEINKEQMKSKYSLEKQIQLKYLKTLNVRLRSIKLKVESGFISQLKQQNDLLSGGILDQMPQDQTIECLICEMSVSQSFQKIDLMALQMDQKIKIFEQKWKLSCDQFRQSFMTGEAKKKAKLSRKQSSMTEIYLQDQSFEDNYRLESNFPIIR